MSGTRDADPEWTEPESVESVVRRVLREELAVAKVDRYGVVDEMLARLEQYPASVANVILTRPKPEHGLLRGHVESMHNFLADLRAALQAERSAR